MKVDRRGVAMASRILMSFLKQRDPRKECDQGAGCWIFFLALPGIGVFLNLEDRKLS